MLSKLFSGFDNFVKISLRDFEFPTAFPSSAYNFCVRLLSLTGFFEGKVASPYFSIANGCPN